MNEEIVAFHGPVTLAGWTAQMDKDPKIRLMLESRDELDYFSNATKRRGKKAGQRFKCVWQDEEGNPMDGPEDAWLWGAGWAHTTGAHIALAFSWTDLCEFWVNHSKDKRFFLGLVEIQEDETPINQWKAAAITREERRQEKKRQEEEQFPGGPVSKNCAMWCQRESFQDWCLKHPMFREFISRAKGEPTGPYERTVAFVREYCQVESRRMLDHDENAKDLWETLRGDYLKGTQTPVGGSVKLG